MLSESLELFLFTFSKCFIILFVLKIRNLGFFLLYIWFFFEKGFLIDNFTNFNELLQEEVNFIFLVFILLLLGTIIYLVEIRGILIVVILVFFLIAIVLMAFFFWSIDVCITGGNMILFLVDIGLFLN